MQQQDPIAAQADELQTAAEELEAELDQFQAVAEGRLDTAISTTPRHGRRRPAVGDRATAARRWRRLRPFLEDAMEQLDEAWAVLEDLAETQCDAS